MPNNTDHYLSFRFEPFTIQEIRLTIDDMIDRRCTHETNWIIHNYNITIHSFFKRLHLLFPLRHQLIHSPTMSNSLKGGFPMSYWTIQQLYQCARCRRTFMATPSQNWCPHCDRQTSSYGGVRWMAFLYLQASVDLRLLSKGYSPSLQSFTLKGKFLPFQSLSKTCEKEHFPIDPSIPTLNPSCPLLLNSLKNAIGSLRDSLVNHIPQQGKENHPMMSGGSGTTSLKSFAFVDPHSFSLKMYQTSLINPMQPLQFSEPFPKAGMMQGGQLFVLPTLESTTTGTDSSSLHTYQLNYKESTQCFSIQTQILPTPTVKDMQFNPHNLRLMTIDNIKMGNNRGLSLSNFAHLTLPTPTTSDGERSSLAYGSGNLTLQGALTTSTPNGGKNLRLNPLFVEWMMGFPPNYTDYAHSETQ